MIRVAGNNSEGREFSFCKNYYSKKVWPNPVAIFPFVSLLLDPRCEFNCQLQSRVTAPSFLARGIKRGLRELECTGEMAEKKAIRKLTFNKSLDSLLCCTRCDLVLFSILKTEIIEITDTAPLISQVGPWKNTYRCE